MAAGGRIRQRASIHLSRGAPLFQTEFDGDDGEDVFVLSFDGTLASTDRARSWMAVSAALKVWLTLRSTMRGLGMDPDHFDDRPEDRVEGSEAADAGGRTPHEWLIRKLSALSSVAQQGDCPDAMLGCDSVLLARLLLEEQSLDGGRSNGRGGKYGGKFHPSNSNPGDDGEGEERSRMGSRPLTVGEIYANWGELRDVTRMRYPRVAKIDGKTKRQDPLPKIRRRLKELFSAAAAAEEGRDGTTLVPSWRPLAYDVLFDCHDGGADPRRNAVILLGHEAQLPWALTVLSSLGREATVTTSEGALERYDARIQGSRGEEGDAEPSLLVVVPDSAREESHSKMIKRIVDDFGGKSGKESNRNVFVTH